MKDEYTVKLNERLGVFVRSDGAISRIKNGEACRWLYGHHCKDGYMAHDISKKTYLVHRIVAETFIPNPEGKPTVDHINRVKDDNRIENLRWATNEEQRANRKEVPIGHLGIRTSERSLYNKAAYMERKLKGVCA